VVHPLGPAFTWNPFELAGKLGGVPETNRAELLHIIAHMNNQLKNFVKRSSLVAEDLQMAQERIVTQESDIAQLTTALSKLDPAGHNSFSQDDPKFKIIRSYQTRACELMSHAQMMVRSTHLRC
jgi:hypothetical protein